MTERINGQGFRPVETAGTRRADGAKGAAAKPARSGAAGAAPVGETVNVSRSAVLLAKLEEIVHSTPAVDADRVRAIKDAIASGRYEIDDQSVADKLLRLDRELR